MVNYLNLSFVHNFAADSWHLTSYLFACLLSFDHISACQNHSSSPPGQVFCCFKPNAAITTWTFKVKKLFKSHKTRSRISFLQKKKPCRQFVHFSFSDNLPVTMTVLPSNFTLLMQLFLFLGKSLTNNRRATVNRYPRTPRTMAIMVWLKARL